MSVNTMDIEQAYTLITALHEQATGETALTPTDLSSFISVAQKTLQAGTEKVMNALSIVLTRTIISVRPYDRKFAGLEVTSDRWGGLIRKISYADQDPEADPTYDLSAATYDPFKINKPTVLQTNYVGSDVYMKNYTIFTKNIADAFQSPEAFGSWISGLMTHMSNEREQWLEELSRSALCNMIAAKADGDTTNVIKLLTEYNALTGLSLTAQQVMQPANFKAFAQWAVSRIEEISRLMTERSSLFQMKITGFDINRHTPRADQKVYLQAKFKEQFEKSVLADAYHDNYLKLADNEGVSYWQSIGSPYSVSAKPVYIDNTGAVNVASANVVVDNVIGVMFDRDAVGYNIYDQSVEASPYNQIGQYYNLTSHARVQVQNDLTEKFVVLQLA